MTFAVLGTTAFVVIMFLCVVIGKDTDEREQDYGGSYFMEQDGFDSGNNCNGDDKE
ncbi:hypothetical protein HED39_07535 [Enterococcus casseliflavus]|uniref:hypothetical protein n=1 Tax=Enterococcus casseliflavus TaxID=37734 RepID=UPI0014329551|nr:hypothetical protein [Enterococcus casseliflavus]MBE9907204.1 hypothetical protein [Enterococcus casseliflavus]NKD29163.1 hypothetical protein [Enterococcus casseliflavus]